MPTGSWLDVRPTLFKAYVTMLSRLKAEERLEFHNGLLAAEGRMMEDSSQRQFLSELERAIRGGQRPPAMKAGMHDLAMLGIKVRSEKGPETPKGEKRDFRTAAAQD